MAYRHLEDRIAPQRIAIVGVLVARRDRKHPQPKHFLKLIFYSADSQVIERTRESALETRLGTTFPVIG
jgi:hypothetical protein